MPHVTDFAKKLDLPIPLPITSEQVSKFSVSPFAGMAGGGLWLTNQNWFMYDHGAVISFRSQPNVFADETFPLDIAKYTGKDNMTTNEAIQMARDAISKLGYDPKAFNVDIPPTLVQGPYDMKDGKHVPYIEMKWVQDIETQEDLTNAVNLHFQINMESKHIIGMDISSRKTWQASPKIDGTFETESEYRKHQPMKMGINTNAPKSLNMRSVTLDTNATILVVPK